MSASVALRVGVRACARQLTVALEGIVVTAGRRDCLGECGFEGVSERAAHSTACMRDGELWRSRGRRGAR